MPGSTSSRAPWRPSVRPRVAEAASGAQMSRAARRERITCRGTVQGVGFRPAVYRLAAHLGLSGWVRNAPDGVTIEIEGPPVQLARFRERLPGALPGAAELRALEATPLPAQGERRFRVIESGLGGTARAALPADTALCADCRREMEDPTDRRRGYPFTTCAHCGPRFSIVRTLPYDRERTSMACFPLCSHCRAEYENPADRRFHAEPLACPSCGPRLWLTGRDGARLAEGAGALERARAALADGSILALKGLGGFQLACRADRHSVIATLRRRKRRPAKPLAVMARDLETAGRLVLLTDVQTGQLASAAAPILLAPRRESACLPEDLAPGLCDLGVMLPTAPLHHELFRGSPYEVLVMTSGNASDEPIARGNREALARLGAIADLFLLHDRDVLRRLDDSVVRTDADGTFLVRRSRGWVPQPLPLPAPLPRPLLALGGHLQVTAALALERETILSQHVGDLDTIEARAFLREAAEGLEALQATRAETIVTDRHPDYASARLGAALARERDCPHLRLPHHLTHAAAVLGEANAFPAPGQRAGALILDGTGWGADGTAWGGEWLLVSGELTWQRVAHLAPFPLVGGEQAVRQPWRVAVALLEADGAGA
ncbi:MAG: carbamoyltransferase HypF, partial [Candidatus Eisenbacteria bacterium]|nr:carbamoyltransferase HypF [Candidatus Eisenbacteria bacterium]